MSARPAVDAAGDVEEATTGWSWRAVPTSARDARHQVAAYLGELGTETVQLNDIALVVSEAVTNVITHAYVGRPVGDVRVAVHVAPDRLCVAIEDDGGGLQPRPDSTGLGLGLPLMATLAERLVTTPGASGGTRLVAWFVREPVVPSA